MFLRLSQETPASPGVMDRALLRTPGADSLMFQTPGTPDSAAYPGSVTPGKRPGSVTFQFPESSERTYRQGLGTNVSLSTWGADFSPAGYSTTPGQVSHKNPVHLEGSLNRSISLLAV